MSLRKSVFQISVSLKDHPLFSPTNKLPDVFHSFYNEDRIHPSSRLLFLLIRECFVSTYQPSILSNQNRILVWVQHPSPRGPLGFTNQEAQAALCFSLGTQVVSKASGHTQACTHTCSSRALRGLLIGGWLVSMLLPFPIGTASTVKEDTDAWASLMEPRLS